MDLLSWQGVVSAGKWIVSNGKWGKMPRQGAITRRKGGPLPVQNIYAHVHSALQHGLTGMDQEGRTKRAEAAREEAPTTMVQGSDHG